MPLRKTRVILSRRPAAARPRPGPIRIGPPPVNTLAVAQQAAGFYRVADPTLARYELYRGIDASPDFTAGPWQTFTALPFTTPALSVSHTHHLVLRRRNAWNLLSQNAQETLLRIAVDATLTPAPPSPPQNVNASAASAGKIRVSAEYLYAPDGPNAADLFLVFLTSDGSAPNPAGAPAASVPVVRADGVAKLSYLTAGYADGTLVKAIVSVRRSGTPDSDSTPSAIVSAVAATAGPASPTGIASLGTLAT